MHYELSDALQMTFRYGTVLTPKGGLQMYTRGRIRLVVLAGLLPGILLTSALPAQTNCSDQTDIPQLECEALVSFFAGANGDGWTNNTGWNQDDSPCDWFGVTCVEEHVTSLSLIGNELSGGISTEIVLLTELTNFDLRNNQLGFGIPARIVELTELRVIGLGNNNMGGPIPPGIGNLTNLQTLGLAFNSFSGAIPSEIGDLENLNFFIANHNAFSGSIPPEVGNLSNLQLLILNDNQLGGSIPPEIGDLGNLFFINLARNQLAGSIPPELGSLGNLTDLVLTFNALNGPIPAAIGGLGALTNLNLAGNQLSGAIPPQIGSLGSLTHLLLSNNQLSGSIPTQIGGLGGLEFVSLSGNALSGEVPAQIGNLTSLTNLDLASNQLSGSIPPELGNLVKLSDLLLRNNQLGDPVPLPVATVGAAATTCDLTANTSSLCMPATSDFQALADPDGMICGLALGCGTDLVLEKIDSADPVAQGETLRYTLTVTNNGPNEATDVVVTDTLPAGVTLVSTSGCAEDPAGAPTCTLGTVASNASAQYTIDVTVDAASGNIENTASVASSSPETNPGDENAAETTTVFSGPLSDPPGGVGNGLQVWFRADQGVVGNGAISTWLDQSGSGRHATQSDPERQPTLSNSLNGLPTVRFDQDSLLFDGTFLTNSNYTVVVVEGRDRFGQANFFLAGNTPGTNQNLILGYESETVLRQAHFANDLDLAVPAYDGTQDFALTTFRFDMNEGRRIYRFGQVGVTDTSIAPLASYDGAALGTFSPFGFFYAGDIAEIVIYSRALSCEETNLVNQELATRWGQAFTAESCAKPGDLNGDGEVDALDVSVLVQELNDGDGEDVADVAGGDFEGTEAFDVNGDELITTDDIGALAELIFDENQECGEQQPGAFPLGVAAASVLDFPRLAVAAGELTGIAIANPNPEAAPVTFRAYGETGQMLAETDGVVPGGAQLPALTFDLFPGLPEGTVGWFQASSPAPGLSGFFLDLNFVTFGELDGADLPPRARSIVFNTVQTTGGASTELNVVNPGEDAASVRLTLVSEEGLVERDVELAGKGAVRLDAATFFELDGQEPARMAATSRYVLAEADRDILGFQFIRSAGGDLLGLNARSVLEVLNRIYIPQIAVLGIIESELGLVNYSSRSVLATVTVHKPGGELFGAGEGLENPVVVPLGPGESVRRDVAELFGFQGEVTVEGWLEIESTSQALNGFFAYRVPPTGATAAVAAVAQGATSALISHLATVGGFFTGVAGLNPSSLPVDLRIIALSVSGEVLGTYDTVLAPGQRISELMTNIIPGSQGQNGGFILMRTNHPAFFISLFGSVDARTFANIPPQIAPPDFVPDAAVAQAEVTPPLSVLPPVGNQQFTVEGIQGAVQWKVNGVEGGHGDSGTISAAGLYSAPALVPALLPVTVSAEGDDRAAAGAVDILNPQTLLDGLGLVQSLSYLEGLQRLYTAELGVGAGPGAPQGDISSSVFEFDEQGQRSEVITLAGEDVSKMLAFAARDGREYLLMAGRAGGRIIRLDPQTAATLTVADGLNAPSTITFDLDGSLLVADADGISTIGRQQLEGDLTPAEGTDGQQAPAGNPGQGFKLDLPGVRGMHVDACTGRIYFSPPGRVVALEKSDNSVFEKLDGVEGPGKMLGLYRKGQSCPSLHLIIVEEDQLTLLIPDQGGKDIVIRPWVPAEAALDLVLLPPSALNTDTSVAFNQASAGGAGQNQVAGVTVPFYLALAINPPVNIAASNTTAAPGPDLVVGTSSAAPGAGVGTSIFFRPGEDDAHVLLFSLDYDQSRLTFDASDTGDGIPDGVISNLAEDFLVYVRHDASCTAGELGFLVVDPEKAYTSIPEQDLFDVGFTIQGNATGTAFLLLTSPGPQLVNILSAPQAPQAFDDVVSGGILVVP